MDTRAHPKARVARGLIPVTESGLRARKYVVCDGSTCDGTSGAPAHVHAAIEVSQNHRSATFDVLGEARARALDADSVIVLDAGTQAEAIDGHVRYRLLHADGTAVTLRLIDDPAPAVPGPGVFVNDFVGWSVGMAGADDLFVVDQRAETVQPLDAPDDDVRYWGPNVGEFLWGVTDDCRAFWATGGVFEERRLDCADDADFTALSVDWIPDGWLQPGRMVVGEQHNGGLGRLFLHVTLDRGATWERIPVSDEASIPGVLRELG